MRARAAIVLTVLLACLAEPRAVVAEPNRPHVVIPGMIGSALTRRDGTVLWGNGWSVLDLPRHEIPDGPRDPDDGAVASPLLTFSFFHVWDQDVHDPLLHLLKDEIGYREGTDLCFYSYDWRQDNFSTARQLADKLDKCLPPGTAEFDILAHSMGGLIAKIFVHRHDGRKRVRRVITMGTPYKGPARAVEVLQGGWEGWGRLIGLINRHYGAGSPSRIGRLMAAEQGY